MAIDFNVSVIVPVYNREQFIRKAVESAVNLKQTGEIVIVDDGSTDNSFKICNQLTNEYSKVKLFQHSDKRNHGISASRNLGIKNASCNFISFLDSDDYYLPNRFLKDSEILLSNNEIDGVYNALGIDYYTENGKQKFIKAGYKYQEFYTISGEVPPEELFFVLFSLHQRFKGEFSTDTITVRKSIFEKVGYFPTYLRLSEDTHLWRRMAAKCKLAAGNITEAVAIRGVHDENTMVKTDKLPEAYKLWWHDLHHWLKNENVKKEYLAGFSLSYLYYKIHTFTRVKGIMAFISFFTKNPSYIRYQYGYFDTYFFDLFGRDNIPLKLISFKNMIIRVIKRIKTKYDLLLSNIFKPSYKKEVERDSSLEAYQKNSLITTLALIFKIFRDPSKISILDLGCSAKQLTILSKYVKEAYGINLKIHENDLVNAPKNVKLLEMDGTNLNFQENKFDFVYSINVYEHIHNLSKCIDEQIRVLKPGGYCYATWYPLWSCAKGHHIHQDMVEEWEELHSSEKIGYLNNGQFIPDWSHLLLTKDQMKNSLKNTIKSEKVIDSIVDYIYDSSDLNKLFFDDFIKMINGKSIKIEFIKKIQYDIPPENVNRELKGKFSQIDFSTAACEVLFKKLIN